MTRWHFADVLNRKYVNLVDGRKVVMPRYYALKMYDDETRKAIAVAGELRQRIKIRESGAVVTDDERFARIASAFRIFRADAERRDRL